MEQGSTGLGEGSARPRERKGPNSPIYSVELEVFEGPLDLLLHLVRKHELDILDIPIAFVAEKYLEYLDVMRQLDLEIAGDYLVMAATLAYLKSRELLPPEPRSGEGGEAEEEEGEDPREALIRRLVEYERFKQAAAELDALPVSGRDVFARGADLVMPPVDPGLAPVSLFNLAEAYYRVLTRAKVKSTHDVTIEPVTVAQRIKQLALMLDDKPAFDFEDLFLGRTWSSERELRQMLVVTLMSILEMVKLGVAGVQQPQDSTTIRIYRRASAAEAERALADYDEDASFGAPAPAPVAEGAPAASEGATSPAETRPPTEADLDAVEEAALLAEALAAVQEPAEPVRGYADDDGTPSANDPDGPAVVRSPVPEDVSVEADGAEADGGGAGAAPVAGEPVSQASVVAASDAGSANEPVQEDSEAVADGAESDATADAPATAAPGHEDSLMVAGDGEADATTEVEAPLVPVYEDSLRVAGDAGADSTAEIEAPIAPVLEDSVGGGEADGPDRDEDRGPGGLFLNTGRGLGARELDVDDEDGG